MKDLKIKYPEAAHLSSGGLWSGWKCRLLVLALVCVAVPGAHGGLFLELLQTEGTFLWQAKYIMKMLRRAESCTWSSLFCLTGSYTESRFFPYSVLDAEFRVKREAAVLWISAA